MAERLQFRIEEREGQPGRATLYLVCERGACHVSGQVRECAFSLWPHAAQERTWQWDGNVAAPTIRPSIDCRGGCGRHFFMTAGAT